MHEPTIIVYGKGGDKLEIYDLDKGKWEVSLFAYDIKYENQFTFLIDNFKNLDLFYNPDAYNPYEVNSSIDKDDFEKLFSDFTVENVPCLYQTSENIPVTIEGGKDTPLALAIKSNIRSEYSITDYEVNYTGERIKLSEKPDLLKAVTHKFTVTLKEYAGDKFVNESQTFVTLDESNPSNEAYGLYLDKITVNTDNFINKAYGYVPYTYTYDDGTKKFTSTVSIDTALELVFGCEVSTKVGEDEDEKKEIKNFLNYLIGEEIYSENIYYRTLNTKYSYENLEKDIMGNYGLQYTFYYDKEDSSKTVTAYLQNVMDLVIGGEDYNNPYIKTGFVIEDGKIAENVKATVNTKYQFIYYTPEVQEIAEDFFFTENDITVLSATAKYAENVKNAITDYYSATNYIHELKDVIVNESKAIKTIEINLPEFKEDEIVLFIDHDTALRYYNVELQSKNNIKYTYKYELDYDEDKTKTYDETGNTLQIDYYYYERPTELRCYVYYEKDLVDVFKYNFER